jgi:hypothetical protein
MNTIAKFNSRGHLIEDNQEEFSFGVKIKKEDRSNRKSIIINRDEGPFSFHFFNNEKELKYINLNEWKITEIKSENYYGRIKLFFYYKDPDNIIETLETGGCTINNTSDEIKGLKYFLAVVFTHFHRISFYDNLESLNEDIMKLKEKKDINSIRDIDPKYYRTAI